MINLKWKKAGKSCNYCPIFFSFFFFVKDRETVFWWKITEFEHIEPEYNFYSSIFTDLIPFEMGHNIYKLLLITDNKRSAEFEYFFLNV